MRRITLVLAFAVAVGCSSKDSPLPLTDAEGTDTGADAEDDAQPICDAAVSKGPWVVAVDGTSARVRWESCRSGGGGITYQPEAGGDPKKAASAVREAKVTTLNEVPLIRDADFPGTFFMHEVALTGLTEGTCFSYTLDPEPTAKGRFCTSPKSGTVFSFASIGDTNLGLVDLSSMLEETFTKGKPAFTLHGGDIQYYASGVETYGLWFQRARAMLRAGAFYPAIGNHESEKPNEREEYVERFFGKPGFDGDSDRYRFSHGGVWFFALDTELPLDDASGQVAWLTDKLTDASKQPGFRFSVIFMHRPLVTCGDSSQNETVRSHLLPLFKSSGVKLVIGAHMHGYERFEMDGVTWITSGGGGGALGNVDENKDRKECTSRKASGGFFNATLYTVEATKISGRTVGEGGATKDTFEIALP